MSSIFLFWFCLFISVCEQMRIVWWGDGEKGHRTALSVIPQDLSNLCFEIESLFGLGLSD